jgi:hypothetical protein
MRSPITCLAFTMSFLLPAIIHADDNTGEASRIVIGGHLGISFATRDGSDQNDTGTVVAYRAGFTGSGILRIRLAGILSAQTEVGFTVKGDRFETDFPSSSSTFYISYLEIPLLLRAGIPVSKETETYGYLGPALGILLDADVRLDDGRFYEVNRLIEPLDIGLMFGAGVAVDVGTMGSLTFDLRYNLGLRNTIRNPIGDRESFNRAIYLTVGYRADLATLGRLFGGAPR